MRPALLLPVYVSVAAKKGIDEANVGARHSQRSRSRSRSRSRLADICGRGLAPHAGTISYAARAQLRQEVRRSRSQRPGRRPLLFVLGLLLHSS